MDIGIRRGQPRRELFNVLLVFDERTCLDHCVTVVLFVIITQTRVVGK